MNPAGGPAECLIPSPSARSGMNHAIVVLVDLEGVGLHLHVDVILFRRLGWYSPRVPAGETSAILETALLDHFAVGVGDREFGFAGRPPLTVMFVQLRRPRRKLISRETAPAFP